MISEEKTDEFAELYRQFLNEYAQASEGEKHAALYASGREAAEANYRKISEAKSRGQDITDLVLLGLLPHNNTKPHREEGAWIHVAPSITKDVRSWFEAKGWTNPGDWPQVAEAIFALVERCISNSRELETAITEFIELPYSKGFQTGMMTPILNALRPDDFILINSKSMKAINYLQVSDLSTSLNDYPQTNALGLESIAELSEVLLNSATPDLRQSDLFDMFSHWMVAVKKHQFGKAKRSARASGPSELADPFNHIFENFEQADQAFDLIEFAAKRLGVKGPGDPLEAFTYRRYEGKHAIHFVFGKWLILGFAGKGGRLVEVHIALFTGAVDFDAVDQVTFSRDEDEPSVSIYTFPADIVFPLDERTKEVFQETLDYVSGRFEGWVRSPHLKSSLSRLADAALDPEARRRLLTKGLPRDATPTGEKHGELEGIEFHEGFTLEQCAEETGLQVNLLESWVRAIHRKGQAIIYGPPGTGKTYVAERLAKHLVGGGDGIIELVQFHPAYAYEDFIQGIRPKPDEDGNLSYPLIPGRLLEFCEIASGGEGTCVLIVDEINRANLSRVFGELMYLLEYRDAEIPLASGGNFGIPSNVRIIGTMNTADRSIALVDHALRRRFAFLPLYPDFNILRLFHGRENTGFNVDPLIRVIERLNRQINDPNYSVGITYFLRPDIAQQLEDIWRMEIVPYLEEYFFDSQEKVADFKWGRIASEVLGG